MDDKCTALLKQLRESIDGILISIENKNTVYPKNIKVLDCREFEDAFTTESKEMAANCSHLLKKLEDAAEIGKNVDQRYQQKYDSNSGADEDEIAESTQEENDSNDVSTDESKESVQDQDLSKPESTKEGKTSEIFEGVSYPFDCLVDSSKKRNTFLVKIAVCNFSPNEVEVKVHKKHLEVHAKHDKLIDAHGIISREFTRKFDIPEYVDTETFRALFDCYGVLHVEASFKPESSEHREIPILLEEESARQQGLQSLDNLGPEFEELTKRHIQDGYEMAAFARNLARQSPSNYIPIEEVITS